ncbi:uncharacterized protein APUU_30112A [Aspergillus puulaauensis]|uniref:Uncharacterized protein n=1 Tax=Aspergillus puulaauensis TaxID=1220207 RepID=A0A7R7XIE1_9EURO|nr:uncharacterized protein APUU_30112A [Aspergillus puulaauensis]BCS21887.1 hypothetical protein APUU_30112A [Aspergillus puulaauensis]
MEGAMKVQVYRTCLVKSCGPRKEQPRDSVREGESQPFMTRWKSDEQFNDYKNSLFYFSRRVTAGGCSGAVNGPRHTSQLVSWQFNFIASQRTMVQKCLDASPGRLAM